jgi:predicted ATPase
VLLTLNNSLGREWLVTDRKTARLVESPSLWIDGEQYQEKIIACRTHGHPEKEVCRHCLPLLAEAANLYRSDFLSGLVIRDSAPFEEWETFQAEQLRRDQASVLSRLAYGYGLQGDYAQAINAARRWVTHDRWDETAHYQLIELLWKSGQRTEALRQYQTCAEVLDKELGVQPSEALQTLNRQIQAGEAHRPISPPPLSPDSLPPPPTGSGPPPPAPAPNLSIVVGTSTLTPPTPTPGFTGESLQNLLTPFVGREAERAQIEQLLKEEPTCRLVMLVGPGGIGKTRLARQIADEVAGTFLHGMAFVSLAPVSSVEFLLPTMARALKFAATGEEDLTAQLVNYLRDKTMLLVLDNLEHLLESAELLDEILTAAPGVKILGTSQERLNLRDEWLFNLGGLEFPEHPQEADAIAEIESYSAAQLFLQTARRMKPGFIPTAEDRASIAKICQLVDGMPLGVELAATWVRLLTCHEIAQELERGLSILETNLRNVPERHRSLRAVFDHSWRLLSPEEQRAYRRMAVFRGGFQPEAAIAVAGATLPLLLSLADRGLLRRRPGGRYNRHPLLWQYAADKLNSDLAECENVRDRHGAYYADFLRQQTALIFSPQFKAVMEALETDLDNVREAWRWATIRRHSSAVEQAADAVFFLYETRGWYDEGYETFHSATKVFAPAASDRPTPPEQAITYGRLLAREGFFLMRLGRTTEALTTIDHSLHWLEQHERPSEIAQAMAWRSRVYSTLGEFAKARDDLHNSIALYQSTTDTDGLAYAFKDAGAVLATAGDYDEAQQFLLTGLNLVRTKGDPRGTSQILNNLGVVALYQGKLAEARAYWEECLGIYQTLNDVRGISSSLNNLGSVAIEMGAYDEAIPQLERSLELLASIGHRMGMISTLDSLGAAAAGKKDYALAHKHFREALRLSLEMQSITDALEELVSVANVFLREGHLRRAQEVVEVVLRHPKSALGVITRASRIKDEIKSLSPDFTELPIPANWEPDLYAVAAELFTDN